MIINNPIDQLANIKGPGKFVIPAGTYQFATWPTISHSRVEIIADGPVFLQHTGTGDAITFDGGANGMFNCRFEGFTILPGPQTRHSLVLKSFHHSRVDVRVHGAGKGCDAIQMLWCVCTELRPVVSSVEANGTDAFNMNTDCTGILLDANPAGSGNRTTACVIRQPIIEGLARGVEIRGADMCTFDGAGGTIENGHDGVVFPDGADRPGSHRFMCLEMEGNAGYDFYFGPNSHNNRVVYCGSPALKVYHAVATLKEIIPNNKIISTTDLL